MDSKETFRNYPKFPGPFNSWEVVVQTNHELGKMELFLVFSSGKREAVLRHLWLKLLWDQLSSRELELLILSLKTSDHKIWAVLKALASNTLRKKEIRRRINILEELRGEKISSRESYNGTKRIRIEIRKETRKLPKPTKYSGYVRTPSSVGTKSRKTRVIETVSELPKLSEKEFDWYESMFSVQDSFLQGIFPADEVQISTETEISSFSLKFIL